MSTPDFSKPSGSGPSDPFGPPPGAPAYGQPGYGSPAYGEQPGQPAFGQPGFGQPGGFGTPAPYGSSGVVGPGGEWLGPPLASWGARFGSYLIDALLTTAVLVVVVLVAPDAAQVANLAILVLLGFLNGTGQTPGKKAVGIKLVRLADGQVLGPGAGIGRQFLHILDALPLLLGYLWPIWDKKNQTFADKIIKSVVIKL